MTQVNNAGCMVNEREVTDDGLEKNFATNTLGIVIHYTCTLWPHSQAHERVGSKVKHIHMHVQGEGLGMRLILVYRARPSSFALAMLCIASAKEKGLAR